MSTIWQGVSFKSVKDNADAIRTAAAKVTSADLAEKFVSQFVKDYDGPITGIAVSMVANTPAVLAAGNDTTKIKAASLKEAALIKVWIENPDNNSLRLLASRTPPDKLMGIVTVLQKS